MFIRKNGQIRRNFASARRPALAKIARHAASTRPARLSSEPRFADQFADATSGDCMATLARSLYLVSTAECQERMDASTASETSS
jgi:hypothetical protein